jgi:alpha-glucosidase (family GH31 glycosyl hydrolase)
MAEHSTSARGFIEGRNYRISVLTPSMLRVETASTKAWEDRPSQVVVDRHFDEPAYEIREGKLSLEIRSAIAAFHFDKILGRVTRVAFLDGGRSVACDNRGNLKGTRRTLDETFGSVPLGPGLLSRRGVAVLDDSSSLLLGEDGAPAPRKHKGKDIYVFAYGTRYRECIQDFFKLCGRVPLIPRYALGNWWSRYRAYSAREYMDLMQRFIDEDIPISVATIDMDWHWVDIGARFPEASGQSGWTGYSWNTDLIPDWRALLRWLKERNLKITLNLHPALGVRPFEDMYEAMAKEMGLDPSSRKPIAFDFSSRRFIEAYFKVLHHPYEEGGVDFWWIDWQQGRKSRVRGLDPLWALNHYHYLDNAREGKRPLILSRYAGPGSHRYPLGFSGDTAISWRTLAFQPRFTATASNIGYTWWSHDIGGHHHGRRDDELYLRWLQLGVFSPVLRLHSTSHDLLGKEPWKYRFDVELAAKEALRFRQRLIPYLYTMNRRTHRDGIALVEPMYYSYPDEENAYRVPNQFFFGSELLVCPITRKSDPRMNLAQVEAWLPPGRWTDIFTGRSYEGNRRLFLQRDLRSIPVLAREGAIIPLASLAGNASGNPCEMEILVYRGKGSFALYEDDGLDMGYEKGGFATTRFAIDEDVGRLTFSIEPARGDLSFLPRERNYRIAFKDIASAGKVEVELNGRRIEARAELKGCLTVVIEGLRPVDAVSIELGELESLANLPFQERCVDLMSRYQASTFRKKRLYAPFLGARAPEEIRRLVGRMIAPRILKDALLENLEG